MKTILVATDGSACAREAVGFAIDLARDTGAELHVVAVRPPTFHGRGGPVQPLTPVEDVHGCRLIADAAAEQARHAGVPAQAHEAQGDEAAEIDETAQRVGADLVVVGSHGHSAVGAALFGSVSRALVKRSRIPVTVVRTQGDRATAAV
jgi:nucleotide-binding universal stress UspA family protein